jgi:hypothetical protein
VVEKLYLKKKDENQGVLINVFREKIKVGDFGVNFGKLPTEKRHNGMIRLTGFKIRQLAQKRL